MKSPLHLRQRAHLRVIGILVQQLFDSQKLIVFINTIRAPQPNRLDLAAVRPALVRNGRASAMVASLVSMKWSVKKALCFFSFVGVDEFSTKLNLSWS